MKKIILVFLLLGFWSITFAQDPHFSQFFSSPMTLNPAQTGKFNGVLRFAANHRNQWPSINNAFTTSTASLDFSILNSKLPTYDTWGIGFVGLTEQSGNKILRNNYVGFSTAYSKGLDENGYHQLAIGFQGVFASKRLDVSLADFQDELTSLGFTGVTQEVFSNPKVQLNYMDLNVGFLYTGSTNGLNSFYVGTSLYHVNRSTETFKGGNFTIPPRLTIQGGGYFPVGEGKIFHTSFIHQIQNGAKETVIGGAMEFMNGDAESNAGGIYVGAWYRLKDAIIPYFGMEFSNLRVGISYDYNNSTLKPASNNRGGTEISLIYIQPARNEGIRKTNCPKF
ncbi:MAG: PorP/SprF family type IX secretion system membrane protein [Chitinophagaceae bacterium]|nr:PorP/SprF family type IX secretion system membrane protein [Chitinophagaceae bacterium]